MEELIRQALAHVEGIGPHVGEGHYDLLSPNGEVILPKVWETTVQPGWSITMHMWPMPKPPPPRNLPSKLGFPPTPAASRPSSFVPGPPPPPPSMKWRGGLPATGSFAPGDPRSESQSSKPLEEPVKKHRKASPDRRSSQKTYVGSTTSDEEEEEDFIKSLSNFVKGRRVFKVGKMGLDNRRVIFQISPKKEGMKLLNDYGRKIIDEARKAEL